MLRPRPKRGNQDTTQTLANCTIYSAASIYQRSCLSVLAGLKMNVCGIAAKDRSHDVFELGQSTME
jgi:hypothetical protein